MCIRDRLRMDKNSTISASDLSVSTNDDMAINAPEASSPEVIDVYKRQACACNVFCIVQICFTNASKSIVTKMCIRDRSWTSTSRLSKQTPQGEAAHRAPPLF